MTRKALLGILMVAAFAAAVVGCSSGSPPTTAGSEVRPAPGGDASGAGAATQPDALEPERQTLNDEVRSLTDLQGDAVLDASLSVTPSADVEDAYLVVVQIGSDESVGISGVEVTAFVADGMEVLFAQRGALLGADIIVGTRATTDDGSRSTIAYAREGVSEREPFAGEAVTFLVRSPGAPPDSETMFVKVLFSDADFRLHGEYAGAWVQS